MDIKQEIVREHSKTQTLRIVKYVGSNKKRFELLLNLFLGDSPLLSQRAGWPLSYCVEANPQLAISFLDRLIANLDRRGLHNAIKRNTLRLLQYVDIPTKLQGKALNRCTEYLADKKEAIAVRAFSMTILLNITCKHPELKNELVPLIENQLIYGTSGIKARAKKVLKRLKTI